MKDLDVEYDGKIYIVPFLDIAGLTHEKGCRCSCAEAYKTQIGEDKRLLLGYGIDEYGRHTYVFECQYCYEKYIYHIRLFSMYDEIAHAIEMFIGLNKHNFKIKESV